MFLYQNWKLYFLQLFQPKLPETALLFYRVTDVPFWNKIGRSSTPVEQQHTRKPPKINFCLLLAVQPYYAIKSNQDPAVIKMLGALGAGFDCASKVCEYAHVQGFNTVLLELRAQCFPHMEPTQRKTEIMHCAVLDQLLID